MAWQLLRRGKGRSPTRAGWLAGIWELQFPCPFISAYRVFFSFKVNSLEAFKLQLAMILSKTHALTPTHTLLDMRGLGGLHVRHARNAVRAYMALTGFLSKSARIWEYRSLLCLVGCFLFADPSNQPLLDSHTSHIVTFLYFTKAHKAGDHLVQKRNPSDNSDPPLVSKYTLFALQPTPAGLF